MDFFVKVMGEYGLKDLPLRIAALLYTEPEKVSLEDIAKNTGYSLASVSLSVRYLENAGMVQRSRLPGSRKVYFYMEKSLIRLNINKLRAAQECMINRIKIDLPPLISKMRKSSKTEDSKKRLKIIEGYHSQILRLEKIIMKWQKDLEILAREEAND